MRALMPWIAAISILIVSAVARAQSPEALFDAGDHLAKAGKLAEACDMFEASNRTDARAGTLIRIGDCREKLSQYASALHAYKTALGRAKDPQKRQIAQAKMSELEPMVSHLTVSATVPYTITHAGHPVEPGEVDGGEYTITAGSWSKTVSVPPIVGNIHVDVPAPAAAPPAPVIPPPAVAARAAEEHAPAQPTLVATSEGGSSWHRPALWIGIGAAVLAGSAAIYWKTRPGESCTGNCIDLR